MNQEIRTLPLPAADALPAGLAAARSMFDVPTDIAYLDSATYGLPPRTTVDALSAAIRQWQLGDADWIADWDRPTDRCRDDFASIVGVEPEAVALIPSVSVGVGTVLGGIASGASVLMPQEEFTSMLFPVLVAAGRGVTLREVPFDSIADAIEPGVDLVAFSLVQMQTGRAADMRRICDAADRVGAQLLVDATQGIPFLFLGEFAEQIDYVVCAGYKHLLAPRGVAFLYIRRDRWASVPPINANWRAANEPFSRYFGGPLTLASDARRFDVSRAWFPWIGAAESLRLIAEWRRAGLLSVGPILARQFATAMGVAWGGSSIVSISVRDTDQAVTALRAAGIRASIRGGRVRVSFHVYNDEQDVNRAAAVLRTLV